MDLHDAERRADALDEFANRLDAEREPLARALVRDLGTTVRAAREDLAAGAQLLREQRALLSLIDGADAHGLVRYDPAVRRPLGRVAIMLPVDGVGVASASSIG